MNIQQGGGQTVELRGLPVVSAGTGHGNPIDDVRLHGAPFLLAAFAVVMFAVGTGLLIAWPSALATRGDYGSWHALGLTDIFALGFATAMVMAVVYQFIPANFHANVRGVRRTQVVVITYVIGVLVFAWSLSTGTVVLAAFAGPLLAVSVATFLGQMVSVILRAKRHTHEGWFHIAAFVALGVVIVAGSLLATSLPSAWLGDPRRLLGAKVVLAVAGWLGMIIAGVSYHTVRGLNGSSVRPRLVLATFCLGFSGVTLAAGLLLAGAGAPVRSAAMGLLVAAAALYVVDVVRIIRGRAATAVVLTWAGQAFAAALMLGCCGEAVAAMAWGTEWAAMAVVGFLAGAVPVAIIANGNRVIPVLIGNRYDGRGRRPLSSTKAGRAAMTLALLAAACSWALLQFGIVEGSEMLIRGGAVLLALAAIALGATVSRRALGARRDARLPRWVAAAE